jgi:hypothetical protein
LQGFPRDMSVDFISFITLKTKNDYLRLYEKYKFLSNPKYTMIKEISISLLLPAEMNTFAGRVLELLQQAALLEPFVQRNIQLIQASRHTLQATLSKEKGNPYTAIIEEKDKKRDTAYIFLRDFVKTATQHPEEATANKAKELWAFFEKHNTQLYNLGYARQSSNLGLLFGDLDKASAQEALQKLGASAFYDLLKKAQEDFELAYSKKIETQSDKVVLPNMRDAHYETGRHIDGLFSVLGILELSEENAEEKAKIDALIVKINGVVDEMMSIARSRKTKNTKEESNL